MPSLIKIGLVAATIYAVSTAPQPDRMAMYDGVRAFASSMVNACTREGSPCRMVTGAIQSGAFMLLDAARSDDRPDQVDPNRRLLDNSPRPPDRRSNGA
jgi:hypothetical protein